jgi:hypothetical protein
MNAIQPTTSRTSSSGNQLTWLIDAATWRHQCCSEIARRVHEGEKAAALFREFSRRPGKYRLSAKSWERVFRSWRRGGEAPCAVALRYSGHKSSRLTQDLQNRFIKFAFRPETLSRTHAYEQFTKPTGRTRRSKGAPVSLCTIGRHLPPQMFRKLQAKRAVIARAELAIARLKLQAEALALALPHRIERPAKPIHFEI